VLLRVYVETVVAGVGVDPALHMRTLPARFGLLMTDCRPIRLDGRSYQARHPAKSNNADVELMSCRSVKAAASMCMFGPDLLVPQDGKWWLSEDPVGTEKTDQHGEEHGGSTACCQNSWLKAPREIEHGLEHGPGEDTCQ